MTQIAESQQTPHTSRASYRACIVRIMKKIDRAIDLRVYSQIAVNIMNNKSEYKKTSCSEIVLSAQLHSIYLIVA